MHEPLEWLCYINQTALANIRTVVSFPILFVLTQRRVAHVSRSEFIHIHIHIHIHTVNILYRRATIGFSLELPGIRIHCTPFESAAEAESKIDSPLPIPLHR